jgi:PAS domain S-box-containing protein/putative nucleotidyltransferase with HDIG domain
MAHSDLTAQDSGSRSPAFRGALVLILFSTIIVLLIGYIAFEKYASKNEEVAQKSLQAVAYSRKSELESFIKERLGDAEVLAHRTLVWSYLTAAARGRPSAEQEALFKQALDDARQAYGYRRIFVVGRELQDVTGNAENGTLPAVHDALKAAINSGKRGLVDVYPARDGVPCFGVAYPLFANSNEAGVPIGAIYLEMNVQERLEPFIAGLPLQYPSAESFLARQEGSMLVHLTSPPIAPASRPLTFRHENLEELGFKKGAPLSTTPRFLEGKNYHDQNVLIAVQPIEYLNWLMVVEVSRDDINKPVQNFALAALLLVLTFIGLLLGIGRLLWLMEKARHISEKSAYEQRLLAINHVSIDGYLEADNQGRIIDVNDAVAAMSGYTRDELMHMGLADLEAKLSGVALQREMERVREKGTLRFQSQWRRKDGSLVDVAVGARYLPYPDGGGRFLSFIRDISTELASFVRIDNLNRFYQFLNQANTSIFNASTTDQVYDGVCRAAVREDLFLLAWAGTLDEKEERVIPAFVYGDAADYVKSLVITTDPALPTSHGPTRLCMLEQQITFVDDFQVDPRTAPWHEMGARHGINASASVPIIVDGKSIAALTFYSGQKGYFTQEMRNLLDEVARNVSLALQAVASKRGRALAEESRQVSETRFKKVFDASPVPMQIFSVPTKKLMALNVAYQRQFGYEASDMPDAQTGMALAFPVPATRQQIAKLWEEDIQRAMSGNEPAVLTSPELTFRCKDGSERIVRGYMTVSGDDIILQWQDLTEIKQNEALLVESEKRFRSMVEQTITGIYVTQHDRVVYANPRMCEIIGWPMDEVVGKDSLIFFVRDPANIQRVQEARRRLHAGESSVSLDFNFVRKDGQQIIVGSHASLGIWDGQSAIIVMAQDITERQRNEEKIRAYVKQLEGTMEGTLKAVANMVELRDPYTSGHERRVGLIAADIAREMGWPEDRCKNLALIGLVHDIGKIGVPAEILSKPGRLTTLEYEIVKAHAQRGYEILKDVEFPLPIADIIRQHHERLDGSGYPQGLKGDAILPEARVLAVADVLESMASHRPYRPALGIEKAVNEIESHVEVWFDPPVVGAMLNLIHNKGYQLPS